MSYNRPYSVNNPFRNFTPPNDHPEDQQYQQWLAENGRATTGFSANNPFIDEADSVTSPAQDMFPTAEEEKRALKQQFQEPPPSYEEAAGPRAAARPYKDEKRSAEGGNTREHRSHSYSQADRQARERRHSEHALRDERRRDERRRDEKHRDERRRESEGHGERRRDERRRDDRDTERRRDERRRDDRDTEKRREERRREKEKAKKSSKHVPPKNVDTIDKLDVTGLFGGAFHHDGPFDACTPHRNKGKTHAPVMAFPVDGPNSTITGSNGDVKKQAINAIYGRFEDDDDDDMYHGRSASAAELRKAIKTDTTVTNFDANVKTAKVHGPTTFGLGSTTFLDGAPAAPKVVIEEQKRIERKKSLKANGLRLSKTRSGEDDDDIVLGSPPKSSVGSSLLRRVKSLKVSSKR